MVGEVIYSVFVFSRLYDREFLYTCAKIVEGRFMGLISHTDIQLLSVLE